MTTMARTDRHRPSAAEFDPADYEFTGHVFDNGADWACANDDVIAARTALLNAGHTFSGVHGGAGQCDHCGATLRYSALMIHTPTRTLIYVGETCLDNRFQGITKGQFDRARQAAQLAREGQRLRKAFEALCEDFPPLAWATYATNIGDVVVDPGTGARWHAVNRKSWACTTLTDIAATVRRHGRMSEKQGNLIIRLVDELAEAEAATTARETERAEKAATRVNAAIGEVGDRRDFTGTVRWFDHFESNYGYTPKTCTVMIIDTPEGTVKWSASNYVELERGQAITIKATVKKHDIYAPTEEITTVVTRGKILG